MARLDGDEFALIQRGIKDAGEPSALAERIISVVNAVFQLEKNAVHTSVSIGIMIPQSDPIDSARQMRCADVAMYKAKEAGRNRFAFFEDAMTERLSREMLLCDQLRNALGRDELFLLYQPQYELATGRFTGVEALLRWRHPDGGVLLPNAFLPAAERRGLIKSVSDFSLRESCRQAREWLDKGVEFGYIAVNLCAAQVNSADVFDCVVSSLKSFDLDSSLIEFEFTETTLMKSTEQVREAIMHLARRGFRFAIDDFGTGFASFRYLLDFHADKIKIGSEFVRDIVDDSDDAAIVEAIVGLGRSLGLKTIAEGVETPAQEDFLSDLGCGYVQGFRYAKPMPAAEIERLVSRESFQGGPGASRH